MHIAIFGLGYVGSVSAACFADRGFHVTGVEPQQTKVDLINRGRATIIEAGLDELVAECIKTGRLRATTDAAQAVAESDMAIVCVGTPSLTNGSLDFRSLTRACEEIGTSLRRRSSRYLIVVRSTVLPGIMRSLVIPRLEAASGKRAGRDFDVVNNPEFLREGTAIQDFKHPPITVIGGDDEEAMTAVSHLYDGIDAPLIMTSLEVAAMVKYVNNAWHALKVTFGNEVGNICKALSIDGRRVMDIFCADTKLNISSAYLKPGFAFGGSCLPKDLRALTHLAKGLDVSVPVLDSIMQSNRRQIERAIERIVELDHRRIGVLGISFKAGTDDLRESPMVELVERLIGKGFDLRLYDRNVSLARLVGANRDYILQRIPHISNLITDDISDVLDHGQVIIVGNGDQEFHRVPTRLSPEQYLVDMTGLPEPALWQGDTMALTGKSPRNRRVLIIVENLPVPFDRRVWQEATTLRDAGYDVSIICPTGRGYEARQVTIDGIVIFRHPLPIEARGALAYPIEYLSALLWQTVLTWRVLITRGFDVIQACNPPDTIFVVAAFFKLLLRKKFIFDHHDLCPELYLVKFGRRDFVHATLLLLERGTFAIADASIATNQSYRRIAIERGGMDPRRVFVVRSGPQLTRMQVGPPKRELKHGRQYLVGYVGVMGKQEGINYLLEAARHIKTKFGRQDIHFTLVGSGPELPALKAMTERFGVEGCVTFTGRLPDADLLDVLNTADVCVNPDEVNEMNDKSTMNKIMEYMALGKPIVQFETTEGRFSAQEASLYAKPNDSIDFAQKLVELLDDPTRRERMGKFGQQRVLNELAWDYEAPKLLAAYDSLWPSRPGTQFAIQPKSQRFRG